MPVKCKQHKNNQHPTVPRNDRRLFSSSVLLSSHSATSPGERRLILQPENFSIQTTASERSRVGRAGRSGWSRDSSAPVVAYTDNTRVQSCPARSAPHLTAHSAGAGMGGSALVVSLCQLSVQAGTEMKAKKRGAGKPRFENPKEVAGYDGIGLNKKKIDFRADKAQTSKQDSSSAKCTVSLPSPSRVGFVCRLRLYALCQKKKRFQSPPTTDEPAFPCSQAPPCSSYYTSIPASLTMHLFMQWQVDQSGKRKLPPLPLPSSCMAALIGNNGICLRPAAQRGESLLSGL